MKKLNVLIQEWQKRADDLADTNPGRSKGWIADQIAKETIANGYKAYEIKNNILLHEAPKRRGRNMKG